MLRKTIYFKSSIYRPALIEEGISQVISQRDNFIKESLIEEIIDEQLSFIPIPLANDRGTEIFCVLTLSYIPKS